MGTSTQLSRPSSTSLSGTYSTQMLLCEVASCEESWHRLFEARWGQADDDLDQYQGAVTWKRRYMNKDAREGEQSCAAATGLMQTIYHQIAVSRRSHSLTQAQRNAATQQPQQDADGLSVSRWRSARGMSGRLNAAPGAKHACHHDRPTFARVGLKTFLCEACGWAHVCDAGCTERVVQRGSGMPVCPISGRCFERMMSEWEEAAEREDRADEGAEPFSLMGRLGAAYSAGYNCSTPAELRQHCGVVFLLGGIFH
ncbi:hypothetical protein WJX73_009069 [Symbiochloris irregularis]|uniref:Uncharacterized protein n=1 Tax=Symbiochloris irregularis TaxID=706552 RepID=A0AAW1PSF5_9CHLO